MRREANIFLTLVLALVLSGIYVVYSASISNVRLERQLMYVALGVAAMVVTSQFNYRHWADTWVYRSISLAAVVLLIAVLIPNIGDVRLGAQRWIALGGMSFQPSEMGKFALILMLSVQLSRNQENIESFWKGFAPPMVVVGVFAFLILLEKDLGTPVVLCTTAFLMMFLAGARWVHLVPCLFLGSGLIYLLAVTSEYRYRRLTAFLDPWSDRSDSGYQLIQSISAFNQGAMWGVGPGAGEQKLGYLPEAHNDFIFAVWGEELGLVGSLVLVVLFLALVAIGLRIAYCSTDVFGTLLAGGIVSMLAFQSAFNMAVTTGLLPTKGLPLPLISWGGTSLIVYMAMMGVVINVALYAEPRVRRMSRAVAATAT
jgi:cell division protein FtsW